MLRCEISVKSEADRLLYEGLPPLMPVLETPAGVFVVDLLVAPGASRAEPPILEPGLPSLAAPGLAYAMLRGATPLELDLIGEEQRSFILNTVKLDAAFVLKAALVASGARQREAKRITDTADAIMLAAACASDDDAMTELAARRKRSDVRTSVRWIREQFTSPRSAAARRLTAHIGGEEGSLVKESGGLG